jgi:uncharacterized membrane protein YeaQ/YmgE (transglycosylase-associated protein family)
MRSRPASKDSLHPYRGEPEADRDPADVAQCDEGMLLAVGIVGALVCSLQLGAVLFSGEAFGAGSTIVLLVLGACLWLIWDSARTLKRS